MIQVLKSMQIGATKLSKYIMINFDDVNNRNEIEHNLKWPYVGDHSYIILIIGRCESGKSNAL